MRKRILSFLLLIFAIQCYSQDLLITAYNGRTSFDQYEEISGESFTLKNSGIVPITSDIYVNLFVSVDSVLSSDDYIIATGYRNQIAAGESVSLSFRSSYCVVDPGEYFFILSVDHGGSVVETDDTNNDFNIGWGTINDSNIDWKFESLSVDTATWFGDTLYHQCEQIYPQLKIVNTGTTNTSDRLLIDLFISEDSVFDEADRWMTKLYSWTDGVDTITSAGPWYDTGPILPKDLIPGKKYYVVGSLEMGRGESNPTNNSFISNSLYVGRSDFDLSIETLYSASYSDGYLSADYSIQRTGTTGVGGYRVEIYLSSDQVLDYSDYQLSYYGDPSVNPYFERFADNTQYVFQFGSLVNEPPPGSYYVILYVNTDNINDNNPGNNTYVSAEPLVDVPVETAPLISITNASFTAGYDSTDTEFQMKVTVSNNGDHISDVMAYDISIKDSTGVVVYSALENEYLSLYAGDSTTFFWYFTLSHSLPYGNYTVTISSTSSFLVASYNAILRIDIPTFEISGIVQGEDGIPINKGKLFLYQKHDNGKVSFINKTIFTDSNAFSYFTDNHQHTLFYIPNTASYPDYVPTILGKTVTLQDFCFFSLQQDIDTVLEILRVVPMAAGNKVISGNVHQDSTVHSGRIVRGSAAHRISQIAGADEVDGFPIVLLSSTGEPVRVTTTDINGNYEFAGLPDAEFGMVVALELDQPIMQEPITVDVTKGDAIIDFGVGQQVVTPEKFFQQEINFSPLAGKVFGDAPFDIDVNVASGLPITVISSDTTVAKIADGKIIIVGAGTTMITASQDGEGEFLAASPVTQQLVVSKASQSISADEITGKTYGDPAFTLNAQTTSGLPLSFSSSNQSVATVVNGLVSIQGAGTATIEVFQNGNKNVTAASVERNLVVSKLPTVLKVDDIPVKTFGNPSFKLNIEKNPSLPVLLQSSDPTIAKISNGRIVINQAGEAVIRVSLDGGNNYENAVVEKQLIVEKAEQGITFGLIEEKKWGDQDFALTASATSFLPVTFSSEDDSVATIHDGNQVTINGPGVTNIIASQSGNVNYKAVQVARELRVNAILGVAEPIGQIIVYPNPVRDFLTINSSAGVIKNIRVFDALGKTLDMNPNPERDVMDFRPLPPGLYFLQVSMDEGAKILKIFKQ